MGEDDNEECYTRTLSVDLVYVEASGPDPDVVDRQFEESVEEAFIRYDEHVNDEDPGLP